jgi:hypothetical protein
MRQALGIAKADFLERSRRFSFIAMISLALFGAFCFVPDNSSLNVIVIDPDIFVQGGHPSWMTIASAWGLTLFLPLMGFFYVSGGLSYDEKTGVSGLVETSTSAGWPYMLGKFLSGVLLLYCIVLTVLLGSVIMMTIKFPEEFPSVYSVVSPYILFLPSALFISALAVLFDSTRILRKSVGAIIYVITFFALAFGALSSGAPVFSRATDITGSRILTDYIRREVLAQSGRPLEGVRILAGPGVLEDAGTKTLIFHGIDWQTADLWGLVGMTALSLMILILSAWIYKATGNIRLVRPNLKKQNATNELDRLPSQLEHYEPRKIPLTHTIFGKLVAETKLMLTGMPLLWYLAALGCIAVSAFLPLQQAEIILPLVLLWPLGVYSAMGCREHLYDTLQYIAILPKGLHRQITLSWLSGILISLVLSSPVILRMFFAGEFSGVFACLCGVIFIPSLALFLGEWSRTRRAFEVVYVTLAYLTMNGLTELAYIEVRPDALSISRAVGYLVIGVVLGSLAVAKRSGLIKINVSK